MSFTEPDWMRRRATEVSEDPEFWVNARFASFRCDLVGDDRSYTLRVRQGRVELEEGDGSAGADFSVHASTEAWQRYISNERSIEYWDCLAMAFQGAMSITGEIENRLWFKGNQRKLFANLLPLYVFLLRLKQS